MKACLKFIAFFLFAALPALSYLVLDWPAASRFTDGAQDLDEATWQQASRFVWMSSPALKLPGIDVVEPAGISALDGAFYFAGRTESGWDLYRIDVQDGLLPERLGRLSSSAEDRDLSLSADGRRLYFASNRSGGEGGYDLYASSWTRDDFDDPELIRETATALDERRPGELSDRSVLFTRRDQDEQLFLLSSGQLALLPSPWPEGSQLGGMSLAPDGRLFYSLRIEGTDNFDLYRSLADGIHFGPPRALNDLNTAADESSPQFDGDGIWFRREARDLGAGGGSEAQRAFEKEIEVWNDGFGWKSALVRTLLILMASLLFLLLILRWKKLHPFFKFLLVSLILHILAMLFVDPIGESQGEASDGGRAFQVTWLGDRSDASQPSSQEFSNQTGDVRPAVAAMTLSREFSAPRIQAQSLQEPRRQASSALVEAVASPASDRPRMGSLAGANLKREMASLPRETNERRELKSVSGHEVLPRLSQDSPAMSYAVNPPDVVAADDGPPAVIARRMGPRSDRDRLKEIRAHDQEDLFVSMAPSAERESDQAPQFKRKASLEEGREGRTAGGLVEGVSADESTGFLPETAPATSATQQSPSLRDAADAALNTVELSALAPQQFRNPGARGTKETETLRGLVFSPRRKPGPGGSLLAQGEAVVRDKSSESTAAAPSRPQAQDHWSEPSLDDSIEGLRSAALGTLSTAMPKERAVAARSFVAPRRTLAVVEKAEEDSVFASRHGRLKAQALELTGGSVETEAAVLAGLRYLKSIQNRDGSWGSKRSHDKYGDRRAGKTGLALLAFLGAGYDQGAESEFRDVVASGLSFLLSAQSPENGHIGAGASYGHGIATYALAEAFASSHQQELRQPLRRALKRILDAQYHAPQSKLDGGWGYYYRNSERRFDHWPRLSVTVWQVMALKSAELGGLPVPKTAMKRARDFILSCNDPSLAALRYNHDPSWRQSPYPTLPGSNSAALFAMQLLDVDENEAAYQSALSYVRQRPPRFSWRETTAQRFVKRAEGNLYFHYYAALGMHRRGGADWASWNQDLKPLLVDNQEEDGSWRPISSYADYAGDTEDDRSYTTSIAVLMLEVYYRYFSPLLAEMDRHRPQEKEVSRPAQRFAVAALEPSHAAYRAGLRNGDLLVALDGVRLADLEALRAQLARWDQTRRMTLTLLRDGIEQTIGPFEKFGFQIHVQ